jgi:hypothetical protein
MDPVAVRFLLVVELALNARQLTSSRTIKSTALQRRTAYATDVVFYINNTSRSRSGHSSSLRRHLLGELRVCDSCYCRNRPLKHASGTSLC